MLTNVVSAAPAVTEPLQINGQEIRPGQRTTINLPIARLYTHTDMTMPVHVICGREPGPRLFVCGAIHGDEINGTEIIRRLLKRPELSALHGALVAVPIVNVYGFIAQSRYLPDRRDLNRSFPGSKRGSLTARIAHLLLQEVALKCTHGIDLHTGSNHRFNLPQIRADLNDPATMGLAQTFGAPVLIHIESRVGSLRDAAADAGIPMLVYEGGEPLRFDERVIQVGLTGVLSVMAGLGMLSGREPSPTRAVTAYRRRWVRAPRSGLFYPTVALGSRVVRGEEIGVIGDPFGIAESKVLAPMAGLVIGRLNLPLVHRGDALFHLASLTPLLTDGTGQGEVMQETALQSQEEDEDRGRHDGGSSHQ